MYNRLANIDSTLKKFEQTNVPQVFDSSQLFSKANLLLYSLQELSDASSSAARRIAVRTIERRVSDIIELQARVFDENQIFDDLTIIHQEIDRLNDLIDEKVSLLELLDSEHARLIKLFDSINELVSLSSGSELNQDVNRWSLLFTRAIVTGS